MKYNTRLDPSRLFSLLLAAGVVLLGCAALDPPSKKASDDNKKSEALEEIVTKLVEAHNKERANEDLPPLELNKKLTAAAQKHAEDMAEHQKMSHEGSNGSTPFKRMEKEGYKYMRAGENVAWGQRSVKQVTKVWMESETHRHNILDRYTEIGVGYATDTDGVPYWCVTFGTPLP